MACFRTRTNYPPIPRFTSEDRQDSFHLKLQFCWLDNHCKDDCRSVEWTFFINGNPVLTLPFGALDSPINIGVGSNYSELILPNGLEDLVDFLEYNGNDIEFNDLIKIEVHAINCRNIQSVKPAIFELIYSITPGETYEWLTVSGEAWETLDGQEFEHL